VRPVPGGLDPDLERIQHLRSGDVGLVRRELRREPVLPATSVYYVVMLLAWDEVHRAAIRALRTVADQVPGQLLDSLLDPKEEFAIRRRIPRVLAVVDNQRVVDGLFLGLGDRRFEVRYQCGRALATIFDRDRDGLLEFARDRVYVAVSNEVAVDKKVWEGQRLLDRADEEPASVDPEMSSDDRHPFLDEFIRYRSNRSMQHVFTLLSLALPKEPLKVSYQGLHTDDQSLRGTALEYLESVLPGGIRQSLWPFIEDHRPERTADKPQDTALEALLRSQASIELNLKELQEKLRDSEQD